MAAFRVFATCNIGDEALDLLRGRGYEVECYDRLEAPPKSLILEQVRSGIDALITTLRDPIDEEVFQAGQTTLKVVAQDAVGFDNIDRQAANRFRIPFSNTAQVLTDATAEFALFILGCASRKLYPSERLVREKKWKTWHPFLPFLGDEVTGKTLGVIGVGRIGKALISKSVGLDMDVLCYDPLFQDEAFRNRLQKVLDARFESELTQRRRTIKFVSFDELLEKADYISLHVALTPETRHLINAAAFRKMKPGAYLVNTSRGPVVDEEALYQALKQKEIAGAALDVFEREPLPDDSPLRDPEVEERLRIYHHFASAGRHTRLSTDPEVGMAGRCVQAVIDVLEGNYDGNPTKMPYVVNKEAFQA